MYPHERSLVEKLAGKPFVLLGVNSDADREALKKVIHDEPITWRSWWDRSTGGPIDKQYGVSAWPTLFILDAQGVIRYKFVGGGDLDGAIETLLKEMTGTTP